MEISRFDPRATGTELTAHDSSGASLSALAGANGEARPSCLRLEPGGVVGSHPATVSQPFMVVEGSGWVRADEDLGRRAVTTAEIMATYDVSGGPPLAEDLF